MRRFLFAFLALLPFHAMASAPDSVVVTGYLHGDLVLQGWDEDEGAMWDGEAMPEARRSVPLALLLSAALPGAGQAYNRNWVRAAVYAGLEVALWAGYASWRGQGLDGERAFQAQAHAGWSPARYGTWLLGYDGFGGDAGALSDALDGVAGVDFRNPGAWSPDQEAAVRRLIGAIRAGEDRSTSASGVALSHALPFFGEQQYYELIGKYAQFNPGWEDYRQAYPDGQIPANADATTAQFQAYADAHDEANDFLRNASRATAVIVFNHVASAFDAMLTARLHNLRLDSNLALVPDANGDLAPVASLRLQF